MRYLITGGAGFLGSNLAHEVLRRGEELFVLDNFSRAGTPKNKQWLESHGNFVFLHGDVRSSHDVTRAVELARPDVVFHVAGQVAMTTSIDYPMRDFETNALGTMNLLEAIRKIVPRAVVIYSSTNKVYGDLERLRYQETDTRFIAPDHPHGFDEDIGLDFRSPYGCSKGAADQYMLDYFRVFDIRTVVFRHSSIFGSRQFSTFDQGWIGWFVQKALESKKGANNPFTISGNGKQVRDVLFASDLVDCYFNAAKHIDRSAGHAFNIGGGVNNSLSLLELFSSLEALLGTKLHYQQLPWRKSDQKVFIADIRKAHQHFDWAPKVDTQTGLKSMIAWVEHND